MSFSLEEAQKFGFHLVQELEGAVKFERVHAAGTQTIDGESVEDGLGKIESFISKFPGIFGHTPSSSTGAVESRDVQAAQSAEAGTAGPTPAADAAAAAAAKEDAPAENTGPGPNVVPAGPSNEDETPVDTSGLVTDTPGETATGRVDVPAEPAEEPAPEGTVQS